MTDRPIIFSAPMIRALMAGQKTQTRRLAWHYPRRRDGRESDSYTAKREATVWQKVKPGDLLWVRESLRRTDQNETYGYRFIADDSPVDMLDEHGRDMAQPLPTRASVPSILMPRWMSRLTLVVSATRMERLQDISREDAIAEGVDLGSLATQRSMQSFFCTLWNGLHGAVAWAANPEVVVLAFKVHKVNVDRMKKDAA